MTSVLAAVGKILLALLLLDVLVIVHEFGHYIAARCCRVTVKEFAIGMGPALLKINGKNNLFSLRAFPVGGYVSMVGEDEDSDDPDSFQKKKVWQRIIIVCAGAVMNLILGLLLTTGLVIGMKGLPSTTIAAFWDDGYSGTTGLQTGDRLLKIDDTKIVSWYDIGNALSRNETGYATVTVERGGEKTTVRDVRFPTAVQGEITYSYYDFSVRAEKKTVFSVIKHGFFRAVSLGKLVYTSFYDLIRGKYGAEEISGPVGTVSVISEAASYGFETVVYLCAFITINLGLFNLFPLPALDGGRLLFLLIELVFGKPVPLKYESLVHLIGFIILIGLIILLTFNDIVNLINRGKEAAALLRM